MIHYKKTVFYILFIICLFSQGCSEHNGSVVVTTSMLESAAREVLPVSQGINIVRLLPPSSCPGHFDLSPRVVPELHSAKMVIRHDYQGVLEQKMENVGAKNISTLQISTGSPLIPRNYYTMVEQMGSLISDHYPGNNQEILRAESEVKQQTEALTQMIKKHAESWKGSSVVAAVNIKEFCEWLGFDVVGIIKRPEDTSPHDLEQLMKVDAEIVIANLQEGMQGAISLGERLNIPVAVLSNFPDADGYSIGYYGLIEENIKRLDEAWQMR